MKLRLLLIVFSIITLCACQESLEDKAERDAKEYTRKYCPTPVINFTRTDSVTFDKQHHVYTYYITFTDRMDDAMLIETHQEEIKQMLWSSVKESTAMKNYLEAGFKFQYVCRSASDPSLVLLQCKI